MNIPGVGSGPILPAGGSTGASRNVQDSRSGRREIGATTGQGGATSGLTPVASGGTSSASQGSSQQPRFRTRGQIVNLLV